MEKAKKEQDKVEIAGSSSQDFLREKEFKTDTEEIKNEQINETFSVKLNSKSKIGKSWSSCMVYWGRY